MDIIVDKGCGVDVHKGTVVACIMGVGIKKEIRTYTTMTNDLLRLKINWMSGISSLKKLGESIFLIINMRLIFP